MTEKPELIVFSENKLGGVQSYFYNLLINDEEDLFDKKWILYDDKCSKNGAKLPEMFKAYPKEIFPINDPTRESIFEIAKRLYKKIGAKEGIVLSSFYYELATLHLYRNKNKRIFFFCHDEEYMQQVIQFEFLIDAFITHNIEYYNKIRSLFPQRSTSVFYLPYGIKIPGITRKENPQGKLKLLVLSRMTKNKGVYDLPLIEAGLRKAGVPVEWIIIGDGPELDNLKNELKGESIKYYTPGNTSEVLELATQGDLYILPSRVDGLPNALLEAMSVGCVPVIAEFNTGIKEVVTGQEGFVLPVGDVDSFVKTISSLHADRGRLEQLSKNARTKISREYNIERRVKDYYTLFKNFKSYKRPHSFKTFKYLGLRSHPLVPGFLKKAFGK
jgi:glycosyltransferase involved in cell wall biosynthesis